MTKSVSTQRWARSALCGALAVVLLIGSAATSARANDDDDDAFDTKFFKGMLRSLGLRNGQEGGIDYRERSPLVVPPSRNLPPPETGSVAEKSPAWPKDADVTRAKQAKADRKKPRKSIEDESMPELPSQLGRTGRATGQTPAASTKDPTAPSTLSELGAKSMFTWSGLWGTNRDEVATFATEPPRNSLTEPPAGYRTPSPNQPYGIITPKGAKPINPLDTESMRGTN